MVGMAFVFKCKGHGLDPGRDYFPIYRCGILVVNRVQGPDCGLLDLNPKATIGCNIVGPNMWNR